MQLFKDEQTTVHFATIDRSMLLTCDEIFLTGSAAQVVFVESVNGRPIGPGQVAVMGPICTQAKSLFSQVIAMKHPRSSQWMSVIDY